jgi:hypothetical protein
MNKENQETMTAWGDETFGPTHPAAIARRMRHEVQELLDGFEAIGDKPVNELDSKTLMDLQTECGDIYIMLCQVAEKLMVDLNVVADFKMGINRGRRWARDPVSGTIRHVTTFKEVGTWLDMDINKFYVLTDSGSFYTSQGFDSAEDALNWARGPEGIEAGADQGVIVPTFAGPQEGWPELSGANVFYARDLYDFWTANRIEIEGETE